MLKKNIKYVDYDDVERNEDFYFNLTEAEIAEMELEVSGGLSKMLERVTKTQDTPTLIKIFKNLILRAYGVKSDDGKRFIKSDKLREEFEQTPAYSVLFMELATNAEAAASFVNGIVPAKISKEMAKQVK